MMKHAPKLIEAVRSVLAEKLFTERQINRIIPNLHEGIIKEPKHLVEIIDLWNDLFNAPGPSGRLDSCSSPPLASPPTSSLMGTLKVNMNHILGDIEPDLLLFSPSKLKARFHKIQDLGILHNIGEHWVILYNGPRGFYLQDWQELTKKIYYIENNIIDFMYDKKEQKSMLVHPLVKNAAVVESDFDQIRTRYMFAFRSGYSALSHLFDVQTALSKPSLKDLVLKDDEEYLKQFAPFCSMEEYKAFESLIKHHQVDDDDAMIYEKLAELNSLTYSNSQK